MSVPASRLIGHKEWAPGRKSDPRYSMDDRRWQVASFIPRSTGHPIIGAIRAAYLRPGVAVVLGSPRGPEVPTLDPAGRWQEFTGGAIYWHPAVDGGTAHIVWGAILARWRDVGSEWRTGFPVTDELPTPDGAGRFNHFTGGASIYWTPTTGAHPVWGAFRQWWEGQGWETGPAGYPLSGEYVDPGGVLTQAFQGGKLILEPAGPRWIPR